MSEPSKRTARDELDRIEDSLVEAILNASEEELRSEITAAGGDPDQLVAEIDSAIGRARALCARKALDIARAELEAWRTQAGKATGPVREAARARFERMRSGDPALSSKMMMAARKGDGLSDGDLEGLLDDIANLERLDGEDREE